MNEEENDQPKENCITCLTWIKKGVAASVPDKIELTAQELQEVIKQTHSDLQKVKIEDESDEEADKTEDSKEFMADVKVEKMEDVKVKIEEMEDGSVNATDEFDFDKYDEESSNVYANIDDIAVINEGKDPLITVGDSEDEDSEKEDDVIKPNDNLLVVGHVIDEASILEVYVYNEKEGSFYCHHHDYLPYIPLCFEWLSYDPSEEQPGNLCAIGNDSPIIDVWDLDVVGSVGPVFKLGRKRNKKKNVKQVGHKDAVLDLAWNTIHNHVLASGSADRTVILWDLDNGSPSTKLTSFEGVVQSIKWHPTEAHMLLTGSMDKKVRLFDCKTEVCKTWKASGEVERVIWNYYDPNICFVSTNNGFIECIDVRQDKQLWQKNVQEEEVAGLSMSTSCPGLLVSSNKDGTLKVWDVMNHMEPQLVFEKQSNLGQILCLEACCDNPFSFAVGGNNKSHNLNVFDYSTISEVSERFKNRELRNMISVNNADNDGNEVMMDVTDDMESININSKKAVNITKKKKPRHRNMK